MTAQVAQDIDAQDPRASLEKQILERREQREKERTQNVVQEQQEDGQDSSEKVESGDELGEGGREEKETEDREQGKKGKNISFSIGDEEYDLDENALFEVKVDGKVTQMTLKEMRDAASGGTAIRNRMRHLADERKKLFTPYKDFSTLSEEDPLSALKKVFNSIKLVDPKADLNAFLVNLGKQAQNLTQMSDSERKAWELERELGETKRSLTEKEKTAFVQERKQELQSEYGLSEDQIFGLGQQLLTDPVLSSSIESEEQLFDRIEDLADEIQRQQAVRAALQKTGANVEEDDPLIFELSTLLKDNPDFDEDDLDEIVQGALAGVKKSRASQVLSKRKRSKVISQPGRVPKSREPDYSKMSPKEALKAQILERRKKQLER